MTSEHPRVIAARWIIPVSGDPINGGWVRVEGDRITEVGVGVAPTGATDLGDVAILPGLVNAHTHLEFSDCREPIGSPGVRLAEWVGQVVATRMQTSPSAKRDAIGLGLNELRSCGVRLVGEITTPPSEYPSDEESPELVTFAEVLGLEKQRAEERLEAASQHNALYSHGAWSPHAPYSTSLETVDACVKLARQSDRPIAMHVAESPDERELLCEGTGAFSELLRGFGLWRDGLFPWSDDPFNALIERLASAPAVLLIHGNDLRPAELERIRHHRHVSVVYCPRTHHFFGHARHPVDAMLASGIRVALGTDSRASNPDLDVWKEVQFLLNHRPDLRPNDVLRMATLAGAEALGRNHVGRIETGCHAGLGTVRTEAVSTEQLYEDLSSNAYQPM